MKKILTVVSLFATVSLFAAALTEEVANAKMITFSTVGPDTYADGTTVLDGECYALVWSADGQFDGILADGKPVDANDKVVYIGSFAKNGHCPTIIFQIPNAAADGVYDVFLLDTRRYLGDSVAVGKTAAGVVAVNKADKVAASVTVAGGVGGEETVVTAGKKVATAAAAPADAPQPKITNLALDGDYVVLTVENTVGYLNYAAVGSEKIGGSDTTSEPQIGGGTITIVTPKTADKGFFKVIRK